jgi:hypothetical protein
VHAEALYLATLRFRLLHHSLRLPRALEIKGVVEHTRPGRGPSLASKRPKPVLPSLSRTTSAPATCLLRPMVVTARHVRQDNLQRQPSCSLPAANRAGQPLTSRAGAVGSSH